jgi:alkanesulfonate monooxygenase SsuD/methylene tetrahydromethanopterin reductase-like flavin-dependent oxidoreductase (luciferase family)
MRFGIVILPEYRWSAAAPRWRRADELGFDHAWTYDHLTWAGLPDSPWYATMPTLTAAAMVTGRIRLGTFVTSPNFRHPLTLTRDVLALDDISAGRFLCGIGSGGEIDSMILGGDRLSPRQLVDRLAEFVELLNRLLTTDHVDHRGEYFATRDARTLPGCVQQPRVPFVIAANGPRSLRLAAEYGAGWVTVGQDADDQEAWWHSVGELSRRLDDIAGDRAGAIDRYLYLDAGVYSLASAELFEERVRRAAEGGFTDVITHWPRPDGPFAGAEATLERVAAEVIPRLRMELTT